MNAFGFVLQIVCLLSVSLDNNAFVEASICVFWLGPIHYSRDSQVWKNVNLTLKVSLTTLLIHLKIILLQYFQQ